ncbi:MAG TPA: cytosine permease [Streptosporangiaceae bacterium]|nr:cytosine permease [Streptosporangiaceae bacterium]
MAQLEEQATTTAPEGIAAEIESHSIDIIPEDERRGKIRSQFMLWFATNANVFNFVLGGFAILFGLNVFWALVALIVGTMLGMAFTALHAVQGPRLGVPQMIQSRGQFGFYGAIFIFLASILLDVGYLAAQQVVQAQSMQGLVTSVSIPWWIIIVTIPAVLLAIFGYHWIHRIQPVLTVLFGGALVAAVILTATSGDSLAKGMGGTHLSSFPIFIAAVGLFFMNMLSWAVYVSDYSRYLPKDVSAPRVFWSVFSGNVLATCLYAGLGIYITAIAPSASSVASIGSIAGKWILPILALSLLGSDALNAYTGMLAVESVRSTWMKVVASRWARVIGLVLMFAIATALALTGYKTFLTSFENFINVLLFFFVPWSVINLIDFYIVKKGKYDVRSFFSPKGIYGGWRLTAIIPYVIALGAQVPFLDQTLYTGPMVKVLGGADISWIVAFVVAGAGYLIATRVAGGGPVSATSAPAGAAAS